ncbi:Uncharacterised protein [Klebsiella pneumoniae]|nr:Uncharacterised protein [Klebsiella pneumoniae]
MSLSFEDNTNLMSSGLIVSNISISILVTPESADFNYTVPERFMRFSI